jgi:medium-chain acyl-[acyl-carrier-protein] hydrolase
MPIPSFTSEWVVSLVGSRAAKHRVICFPNAGGSATAFKLWAKQIPPEIELFAVQLPGRQKRVWESPLRDLQTVVQALVPDILKLSGPNTIFFGDCTGALIAYETIRAAALRGIPVPRHLLVSCCRAPDLQPRHMQLHALDEDALITQMRQLAFAPEWLLNDERTLKSFLPLLRCDFEMAELYAYQPGPPLRLPITAVAGTEDKITPETDVAAWQRHTTSKFNLVSMAGSHDVARTRISDIMALVQAATGHWS